jgi:hypothetical protein
MITYQNLVDDSPPLHTQRSVDRLQPFRAGSPVRAPGGSARRQSPQLAAGAAAHPQLNQVHLEAGKTCG